MNSFKLFILIALFFIVLAGCTTSHSYSEPLKSADPILDEVYESSDVSDKTFEKIQYECTQISLLYHEMYVNAEREPSPYLDNNDVLPQDTIDMIEKILGDTGYPVINSDIKYPDYLVNADGLYSFWKSIESGQNDETTYWRVLPSGGIEYRALQFTGGKAYSIIGLATWSKHNVLNLDYVDIREVYNWGMTFRGDFYFQDIYTDKHWDATTLLRLLPVDRELYDWNLRCVLPIGYKNINTFLCEWDSEDYGELSFNDMYGNLHKMETNEYTYAKDYEHSESPYYHCRVPAQTFESTDFPYFNISLTDFRKRASYNEAEDIYPWQDINISNVYYFPSLIPEVTEVRENSDGSVTLCVTVMCLDKQTDCIFKHEVTIMPQNNGKFQYLSNQITYRSNNNLPSNSPRIPAQMAWN